MIARAGNVAIFNRICSSQVRKVALAARRVQFCVFWVGSCSERSRIMLGSVAHWKWRFSCFQQISVRCWVVIFRGKRSIWWGWRVLTVAPRIVNDVSYVMRINHEIHFAWQAQYLVKLEAAFCCSAHCKWRFICDVDQSWDSFCVAGAVFGDVGGWLYLLHALEMTFHMWRRSLMTFILRGRRSIWWSWRVMPRALRIVNDVSYAMRINPEIHFAWAGAVFAEVGGCLLLLRAL